MEQKIFYYKKIKEYRNRCLTKNRKSYCITSFGFLHPKFRKDVIFYEVTKRIWKCLQTIRKQKESDIYEKYNGKCFANPHAYAYSARKDMQSFYENKF